MKSPNILMILADGMNADTLRFASDCKTPNFDRLAKRGVRLNRAHTVNPVCSPARASLMTGVLPHNHGVLQVEHCVDDDQSCLRTEYPHWAQNLSAAGYRTGYFGKWHIERSNRLEDFGWQVNGCDLNSAFRNIGAGKEEGVDSLLKDNCLAKYTEFPEGYNRVLHYAVTNTATEERKFAGSIRNACQFVEESSGTRNKPWACCVSFSEPNAPVVAGHDSFAEYDVDAIRLPENLHDELSDRPGLYRREREILSHMTERQWRELRAVYFALISELDSQFGRIIDCLENTGELEDTIIIVTSDHGRYIGGHGFDNHNIGAFEEAYRIPMIVAGPGIANDADSDALVTLPDLCPTIIDMAGAEPIDNPDSKSFRQVLADPEHNHGNTAAYAEYHGTRYTFVQRVLWEDNWKFVFNGFDYDELYDLECDPYEMRNLAGCPEYRDRTRHMMSKVWERIKETNDKALLETHYSALRIGVVGPNS